MPSAARTYIPCCYFVIVVGSQLLCHRLKFVVISMSLMTHK